MPGLPLCNTRRNKKKLNFVTSVLSLSLQNTCLFGHVTKCLKRLFTEGILDRNKAGILFVLGLQQEREGAG